MIQLSWDGIAALTAIFALLTGISTGATNLLVKNQMKSLKETIDSVTGQASKALETAQAAHNAVMEMKVHLAETYLRREDMISETTVLTKRMDDVLESLEDLRKARYAHESQRA